MTVARREKRRRQKQSRDLHKAKMAALREELASVCAEKDITDRHVEAIREYLARRHKRDAQRRLAGGGQQWQT